MAAISLLTDHFGLILLLLSSSILSIYVVYQCYFHPLAKYPGPFLAKLTDLWQVYQFLTLKQPYNLTRLHEKYGPFVRYGPENLSTTCEEAVLLVYQKGGRHMPKTEFYDGFGAAQPTVFGMRDESMHSFRRRHMSYSFSMASVKEMEPCLDANLALLKDKLARFARSGETFDLKKALQYYVIDVLGDLAFSRSFGLQLANDDSLVPPVKEHTLIAAATGAWPAMTTYLKRWLPRLPYKPLRILFQCRQSCVDLAAECVQRRLTELGDANRDKISNFSQRKDLLTSLVEAKHPDTGARLSQTDLKTESFGFIVAGTHTTAATTSLLFWQLLKKPEVMSRLVAEIDANLPPLAKGQPAHSITLLESSLAYLKDCMKENFRINPVFTMPLARQVTAEDGIFIEGEHIPQGTSIAICNHAFHHNPNVWGPDHEIFRPARWADPKLSAKSRLLMHFGMGGRQCIGKTIATTNIYKITSALLQDFEFELVNDGGTQKTAEWTNSDVPEMISVGISDLQESLVVRCRARMSPVLKSE